MPGQIDRLDRQSAIELAKRMRSRARNASMKSEELMKHAAQAGGAVGGAYLLGHLMGGKEVEYEKISVDVEAGNAEDPRQIMGADIELVIGVVGVGAGLAMQGLIGKKSKGAGAAASFVEGIGLGALSAYAFTSGADSGRKSAQESDAE